MTGFLQRFAAFVSTVGRAVSTAAFNLEIAMALGLVMPGSSPLVALAGDSTNLPPAPASQSSPAPAGAAAPPTAAGTASSGATPDDEGPGAAASLVLEDFPSYLKEVETIRGLTFTRSVAKGRQSLAEFRTFLAREIEREMPAARSACTSRALGKLGLLPERFDLSKAYEDVLISQVAAYYNPESKVFYVVRADLPPEALRPTVIHELAHALQDQRFDLGARIEALRRTGNEDEENAFRFLAEGEATYVMTLGALRDAGLDPAKNGAAVDAAVDATASLDREGLAAQMDSIAGLLDPASAASLKSVLTYPDYLFHLLLDPYYAGQRAVHRAFRRGGWAAVNDLWKNPPRSTELLLHPEKLAAFKRDDPVRVEVPDLSAALGPGYAPACENTLGELETEMLLEATLPKPGEDPDAPFDVHAFEEPQAGGADRGAPKPDKDTKASGSHGDRVARAHLAAAGWGGDRYRAFEKSGGGTVVVWKTVWDTEGDAIEFDQAIRATFGTRLPTGGLHPPVVNGFKIWGAPAPGPALLVLHHGREVTFVSGANDVQARAVLAVLDPSLVPRPRPPWDHTYLDYLYGAFP